MGAHMRNAAYRAVRKRGSFFVELAADGIRLPFFRSGDLGTSPFLGSSKSRQFARPSLSHRPFPAQKIGLGSNLLSRMSPGSARLRPSDCPRGVGHRGQSGLVLLTRSLAVHDPEPTLSASSTRLIQARASSVRVRRAQRGQMDSRAFPSFQNDCNSDQRAIARAFL